MYLYHANRLMKSPKTCCNLFQSLEENERQKEKTLNSFVYSKNWTLKKQMLLTIQRFDSTVDLPVIMVCEVAMINGTKVTWRKE